MWCFALACALANTSFNFAGALGFCITYNVLQLGEVADLEAQMFNLAQTFIRNPDAQFSTKPAILPNCCACCTTQIYK